MRLCTARSLPRGHLLPLDPSVKRLLDIIAAVGMANVAELTPQQMRDGFRRLAQAMDVRNVPVETVTDGEWPGPAGALPFRSYRPRSSRGGLLPGLIFFHGGGGIFGSIETHDGLCRVLSAESGCAVISVRYRQAPEHRFPAAVEDAYAATTWIVANAQSLGLDARRRSPWKRRSGGRHPRRHGVPKGSDERWTTPVVAGAVLPGA